MATVPLHASRTLPSLLNSPTPRKPAFSHSLSLLPKSAQYQFHGLKLSTSSHLSITSSAPAKFSIVAKVTEGTIPPAFTLKDQSGRTVSLSKFKGKPVVVYFYPADETPGCTKQDVLTNVQELLGPELFNVRVLGVSIDYHLVSLTDGFQ